MVYESVRGRYGREEEGGRGVGGGGWGIEENGKREGDRGGGDESGWGAGYRAGWSVLRESFRIERGISGAWMGGKLESGGGERDAKEVAVRWEREVPGRLKQGGCEI